MTELSVETGRYEIKFVTNASSTDTVMSWFDMNIPQFRRQHPPRTITSLYFDTHDLQDYQDNLAGISRREKVRLRWYGDCDRDTTYRVEAKLRRATIGWKIVHEVALEPIWDRPLGETRRNIAGQLPDDLAPRFDARPLPVLTTQYRRDYFVSEDQGIRATIDRNVRFIDQRRDSSPSRSLFGQEIEHTIVEFKFAVANRDDARAALGSFPFRASRSSKYVNGVKLLLGNH